LKKKNWLGGVIFSLSLLLIPGMVSAEEGSEKLDPKVTVEELTLDGETFELLSWEDKEKGETVYSISSEIEDKAKVAAYVDELIEDRNRGFSTFGVQTKFSYALSNTDSLGKLTWDVSGYSEPALTFPLNPDTMRINDGTLNATFTGTGNADKIILNTKYIFNNVTGTLSASPSISVSSSTASWKSAAVTGQWYVNTKSLWAQATSRTMITSVEISAGADIYKGSNIYRPSVYKKIPWQTST